MKWVLVGLLVMGLWLGASKVNAFTCGTCPGDDYTCGFDHHQCCSSGCTCECGSQCSTGSGWNSSCPGSFCCGGGPGPTVTPTPVPTGLILGRIELKDYSGNNIPTKCLGCSYGGQAQCENRPTLNKTVTISGVGDETANQCNGSGPYYSAEATTNLHTVSVNVLPGENVTWSCTTTDGSGNLVPNCPGGTNSATGSGGSVGVTVPEDGFAHIWFYFDAPVCNVSGPGGAVAGDPTGPYGVNSVNGAGVTNVGVYGATAGQQNWNQLAYNVTTGPGNPINYSSGLAGLGTAIFSQSGTYDVVCNAYNNTSGAACTGNTTVPPTWVDCGPGSRMQVTALVPTPTPSCSITAPGTVAVRQGDPLGTPVSGLVTPAGGTLDKIKITFPGCVGVAADPITMTGNRWNSTLRVGSIASCTSDPNMVTACYMVSGGIGRVNTHLSFLPSSWWQVGGGDVTAANGRIQSLPPPGNYYVMTGDTNGVPGLGVASSFTVNDQWIDPGLPDWRATVVLPGLVKYSYLSMRTRMLALVNPYLVTTSLGIDTLPALDVFSGTIPVTARDNNGVYYTQISGSGGPLTVIIPGGTFSPGRKLVLFVDGDVNITGRIKVDHNAGEVVILASGNITLNSEVDLLEGVYYADKVFDTGSGDTALLANGTIIGQGGVTLGRQGVGSAPAERFVYVPQFIANFPSGLLRRHIVQDLLSP